MNNRNGKVRYNNGIINVSGTQGSTKGRTSACSVPSVAYLKNTHNARLIYDPSYPRIDRSQFKSDESWQTFYGDVQEVIPPNAPVPRGRSIILRLFVDSYHAGNMITRRPRTGFFQLITNANVNWFSKKKRAVESSTLGSEFVALKTAMEANRDLRYKLRMMGVPIHGQMFVFCDTQTRYCKLHQTGITVEENVTCDSVSCCLRGGCNERNNDLLHTNG
jgi:hypothetical protein